eukprot:CAMPEP_0184325440 /NCGR_PEP_ID=MMETSP1049-20130417/140338_1 /TAXON_ID=77928 /ORGANISM="Proteomonas sulcata, Strain CCMP704" /LENGTH=80 /DNA_ID=CAMNT_0026647487 /DNA_START=194 /DNA_END=432 /DNA_ORIENTATION=+
MAKHAPPQNILPSSRGRGTSEELHEEEVKTLGGRQKSMGRASLKCVGEEDLGSEDIVVSGHSPHVVVSGSRVWNEYFRAR